MAGKHKGVLRIAIEDFLETFDLGDVFSGWFTSWGEKQEKEINLVNADLMKLIRETPDMPDVLKKLANYEEGDDMQGGIATALSFASQIGTSAAGGAFAPFLRKLGQRAEQVARSQLPDIGTLIKLKHRGLADDIDFANDIEKTGWSNAYIEALGIYSLEILGAGDLLSLWKRGELTDSELEKRLREISFSSQAIREIKVLSEIIPGVGDLINMTVREAFNPEIVKKFGYDQDFPSDVLPFTEAQGLSREWVEKYWWSHWSVPSVGQGFEMLHRLRPGTTDTPFTEDDLYDLLKTLDIAPYWRGRLTQVSYSPLTRVDVRRMNDLGILNRDGVKAAYLDSGYNDHNAELMTDFTIAFNQDEEKALAKSVIISAFKKGLFTEAEALTNLTLSGMNSSQAQFYIDLAQFDILEKETDAEIDLVHDLYILGEIEKSQAHGDLNALSLPIEQIDRLLRIWELEKLKKIRLPSESELETFYKLDYISEVDYEDGLKAKNYKPETIPWFIRQADQSIAEAAAAAEQKAIDAQKRIEDIAFVSEYRIKRAALDVSIAQEKSNIAEIKLLAHDIEEPETLENMKGQISAIKFMITNYQLEKANLKLSAEEES